MPVPRLSSHNLSVTKLPDLHVKMMFVLAAMQGVNGHQYFWLDGAYQSFKRGQVGMPAGVDMVKCESLLSEILHEILGRARLVEVTLPQGIDKIAVLHAFDLLEFGKQ